MRELASALAAQSLAAFPLASRAAAGMLARMSAQSRRWVLGLALLCGACPASAEPEGDAASDGTRAGSAAVASGGSNGSAHSAAGSGGTRAPSAGAHAPAGSGGTRAPSAGTRAPAGSGASGAAAVGGNEAPGEDAGVESGGHGGQSGSAPTSSVECDPRKILCKRVAPSCRRFEVPSVDGSCFGPCVGIEACRCSGPEQCPDSDQYTCHMSAMHCTPYL